MLVVMVVEDYCRVQRFGGASCSASKLALPF
jgi:hypothetical protein